jgi:hypothetical protein
MAMSENTLATELKAMGLHSTEVAAAAAWATAFANYFKDAESNATPINVAAIPAAKTAMQGGLSGMSASGAAAGKIAAAIGLFWAALVPAIAWATVTAIAPPSTLATLATDLQDTFDDNTDNEEDKDTAIEAIAATIHGANVPPILANQGQATWPGPTPMPIT